MTITKRIRWTGNNITDIVRFVPAERWFIEEDRLMLVNLDQPDLYVKPGQLIIVDNTGHMRIEWEQ
jgi:hypothetical protein